MLVNNYYYVDYYTCTTVHPKVSISAESTLETYKLSKYVSKSFSGQNRDRVSLERRNLQDLWKQYAGYKNTSFGFYGEKQPHLEQL